MEDTKTYRIPIQRVGHAGAAIAGAIAFAAVADDAVGGRDPGALQALMLGWGPAILFMVYAVRAWVGGVQISERFVRVRNPLRTYTFAVDDVSGFFTVDTTIMHRPIATLCTKVGARIKVSLIRDSGPLLASRQVAPMVAEMNAALDLVRR